MRRILQSIISPKETPGLLGDPAMILGMIQQGTSRGGLPFFCLTGVC